MPTVGVAGCSLNGYQRCSGRRDNSTVLDLDTLIGRTVSNRGTGDEDVTCGGGDDSSYSVEEDSILTECVVDGSVDGNRGRSCGGYIGTAYNTDSAATATTRSPMKRTLSIAKTGKSRNVLPIQ